MTGILKKSNIPVPPHLVVQADNTCRENRNQFLCLWGAHLVSSGVFDSVTFAYYRTGHTHNLVDQKFATMAANLARAGVVETPQEGGMLWPKCF